MNKAHPVLAFEQRRVDALRANDLHSFAGLLDDELVYIHFIGLVHGKPEVIGGLGNPRGAYGLKSLQFP